MADFVFYPDAHPESTSVDGGVGHAETDMTWANLRAAAGSQASDGFGLLYSCVIVPDPTTDLWYQISRGIVLFDTSPSGGVNVESASLFLWGLAKLDELNITPDMNIYSSAPASNTALEAGDFNSLGSTPFCDTALTYANFIVDGYNEFVLNAAGIAAIDTSGITKLGLRNANYDVSGTIPTWNQYVESYLRISTAEGDADKRPKLEINFGFLPWVQII